MRVTAARIAVTAGLLALLTTTVWFVSRETAPPTPSPTPWLGPPPFSHELDLAVPPGELASVAVPVGQFLDVTLLHAPLPARYRLTQEVIGPAPSRSDAPWESGSPLFGEGRLPPDCGSDVAPAWNALTNGREEAEVQKTVEALRAAAPEGPCREAAEKRLIVPTRRVLKRPRQVPAGTRLRVTVERLAAAGPAVERKWSIVYIPGRGDFGWRYPTEQAWIAASIAQDLADLSAFAAGRPAPGSVRVTLPEVEAPNRLRIEVPAAQAPLVSDLSITTHVWDPDLHVELARQLQAEAGLRATLQAGSAEILPALTRPVATVLLREARRLSDRLSREPADARAHEQAALLWCVFGLRESSGPRGDRRPALSRATAQLSFARALRAGQPASRDGTWAAVLIATLAGRSLEAVQMLEALPAPSPTERAWIAAVRLRNDGDWRKVDVPRSRTLLEQLEFVRAKAASGAGMSGLAALEGVKLAAAPDWARITLASGPTIDEERRFVPSAIALELDDVARAHDLTADLTRDLPRAARLLAAREAPIVRGEAGGRGRVEVLGPGAWSASAARHVLEHAQSQAVFLESRLGLPEDAEKFRLWVRPLVEPLPVFPLLETSWRTGDPPPADRLCTAGKEHVVRSPMEVPAGLWAFPLDHRCAHTPGFPPARAFFDPPVPHGTTLDARKRSVSGYLSMALTLDDLKAFRELAPYDSVLAMNALQREHKNAAPAELVVQQIGPFADYQVSAGRMALAALAKDPSAHRLMAQKLCTLSADHCGSFAHDLLAAGDQDGAAKVYERILAEAHDRVAASHEAQWLVAYYEDRGNADRALQVASQAASVGSFEGLAVLGRLYERRGRLADAERVFRRMAERYDKENSIQTFYIRASHRKGGERYAPQAIAAKEKLFPQGLVRLPQVLGTPRRGSAVVMKPSDGLLKAGIRAGAVVVGLDGYLVENAAAYGNLKAVSAEPTMKLMIWQDGKYVEVEERRDRINYIQ